MKLRLLSRLCLLCIGAFVGLNLLILASLHFHPKYTKRLWSKVTEDLNDDREDHVTEKDAKQYKHWHVITEEDFFTAWDNHFKEEKIVGNIRNLNATSPQHVDNNSDNSPRKRNFIDKSCTMDTCFNFSRCQKDFRIYIYPKEGSDPEIGPTKDKKDMSPIASKILDALRASKYVTTNPEEACLFIPSVDTVDRDPLSELYRKNVADRLLQLPYWQGHGANHLLFNLYAGSWPDYFEDQFDLTVDRAILVKASYSQLHFRHNYDISLPLVHNEHELWPKPAEELHNFLSFVRKRYLLSFKGKRYITGTGSVSRNALYHLHNGKDILILTTCRHGNNWRLRQDARCQIDNQMYSKYDYRDLMYNSTLCLIPRGRRLGSYRFLEALEAGCVPVLLSNDYVLPFAEVIDWNAAALWADERTLFQITDLVRNLGDAKIVAMRQQVKFLWDAYFSSVKSIVDTVLEIIRDRLEIRKRSLFTWNSPPLGGLLDQSDYSMDFCDTPFSASRARCAAAYDRGVAVSIMMSPSTSTSCDVASLSKAVREMSRSKRVRKIMVLWSCPEEIPSTSVFSNYVKTKNLLILKLTSQQAKSPSSRYLWTPDVVLFLRSLSAILSLNARDIGSDRDGISSDHVDFAFNVWREFPDRLVGFRSRGHYWDEAESVWRFSSRLVDTYSMVTGPMLFHKYYAYLYFKNLSAKSRQLVDLFQCCEDFLLNFLAAHVTKRPPIRVLDQGLGNALSSRESPISAAKMQDKMVCFHALARDTFNYMPLRRSHARWDPLLFRDEVASWRKKYSRLEQ